MDGNFLKDKTVKIFKNTYFPKLVEVVTGLTDAQIWWRPHSNALSIGVIIVHLEGNIRQHFISGLSGTKDTRDRASEFENLVEIGKDELISRISKTVLRSEEIISSLQEDDFKKIKTFQGKSHQISSEIFDTLCHFVYHVGQVIFIAKQIRGECHGIQFSNNDALNVLKNESD